MTQDSKLQEAVLAAFDWEPGISAGQIGVSANAGVVSLSGYVDSYAEKHAAETAALRVKGVHAIAEAIKVRLAIDSRRTDAQIAAAAIERLSWNVGVPKDSIQVQVENGWITLTGEVDWWYQAEAAIGDIRPLHGVVGVTNRTSIKPRVNTATLSDEITHALHRSWFFDPDAIKVRAHDGTVTLTGTAHSSHERQVAAETAWAAPGTRAVENKIDVVD